MQGILERVGEVTAFLNPLTNSYARFGSFEAPRYVTWSHQNRSQLIRVPAASGEYSRLELRSADASCNPYLAFALLLHAGLDGIEEKRVLCEPKNLNLYEASPRELAGISTLPANLGEALAEAKESAFVKQILPQKVFHQYIGQKEREFAEYVAASDKREFERERYFERI